MRRGAVVTSPLPTEVAELARKLGATGSCRVVHLSQLGRMSSGPPSRWIRFRALDEIETSGTAFDWEARFGRLSCLTVVDRLSSEAAASELRFLAFRLSGAPADESALRKGQIVRYLGKLGWAPDAILPNRSLEWLVREDGFRVSHPSAHERISVEIQLDEAGRIGSVSAKDRPRMETGRFVDRLGAAASRTTASAMADGYPSAERSAGISTETGIPSGRPNSRIGVWNEERCGCITSLTASGGRFISASGCSRPNRQTSARFSDKVGMFWCGMRSRNASLFWSKSGVFPMYANGGAWSVALV
ncbi:DUF6544 family protein [Bradyrhizobium sp. PUT101]|uniref:DUF6544 family protein n=1 Tax=Bradyrhizobium sp. PUT101 TaxID=3447427 RepID=UPI003F82A3CD